MKYPIEYIRKDIPSFDIPPYEGQRYETQVPDTLDIQERVTLAVNGLTGPTDPEKDHMLYFNADFRYDPPSMRHRNSDICQTKFEESLPLMRLVSGSRLNDHIDPVWMANALRQIGAGRSVLLAVLSLGEHSRLERCLLREKGTASYRGTLRHSGLLRQTNRGHDNLPPSGSLRAVG